MEAAPHHRSIKKVIGGGGGGGGDIMPWYPEEVHTAAGRAGVEAARQNSRGSGGRTAGTLVTRENLAWDAKKKN